MSQILLVRASKKYYIGLYLPWLDGLMLRESLKLKPLDIGKRPLKML